jgi:proteasome assembly chaperone (PAC2) family protein
MVGQIFGIAGLMVGLARLRGFKSFSLLVDTLGTYPDATATRYSLSALDKLLHLNIDLSRLEATAEETKKVLESFGVLRDIGKEKKKEEQRFRLSI